MRQYACLSAVFALAGCGSTDHLVISHRDGVALPTQNNNSPQAPAPGVLATGKKAPLRLAVDPNVLVTNTGTTVPVGLQQEVKRQFLEAVALSGLLTENGDPAGALVLKEIGIAKTETTKVDVDVTADGKVNVKSSPLEGDKAPDAPPALGANVNMTTHVMNSTYTIALAFEDKTSGGAGEIIRIRLEKPLQVEENMRITSKVKLSFNMIKALPAGISMIIARFIDDISLSLDAGVSWEHSSELSNRMFFKATDGKATALIRDFLSDIVQPLCETHAQRRGVATEGCEMKLPVIDNPVDALAKRFVAGVREVKRCEPTGEREGLTPLYKLYVEVPSGVISFRAGEKVFAFEKSESAWKKLDWAEVLGATADRSKCGDMAADAQCAVIRFGAQWFDDSCSGSNSGASGRLGLSTEESAPKVL